MKKSLLLLTALLFASSAAAQKFERNIFAVRAGVNISTNDRIALFGKGGGLMESPDIGVRVGIGFTLQRIYLGMNYDFGCLNALTTTSYTDDSAFTPRQTFVSTRNGTLRISVGYNF